MTKKQTRKEEEEPNLSASNENDSDDSKQEEEGDESAIEAKNVPEGNNNNNNNNNIAQDNNNNNNNTMATFDSKLEALFKTTLEKDLTHPIAMAFMHDGVETFSDFLEYEEENIVNLSFVDPNDSSKIISLSNFMRRIVYNLRYYCEFLEKSQHPQAMDPTDTSTTVWTLDEFKSWTRNDMDAYIAAANVSTATQPTGVVGNNSGARVITQEKKDTDALTGRKRQGNGHFWPFWPFWHYS